MSDVIGIGSHIERLSRWDVRRGFIYYFMSMLKDGVSFLGNSLSLMLSLRMTSGVIKINEIGPSKIIDSRCWGESDVEGISVLTIIFWYIKRHKI